MPDTFIPTNIGYTPTGSIYGSQVIIGRDLNVTWEACGPGNRGRPDQVERVIINLTYTGASPASKIGSITINADTLKQIMTQRPLAPTTGFAFSLREVYVCENLQTKAMLILASQTYPTGSS